MGFLEARAGGEWQRLIDSTGAAANRLLLDLHDSWRAVGGGNEDQLGGSGRG